MESIKLGDLLSYLKIRPIELIESLDRICELTGDVSNSRYATILDSLTIDLPDEHIECFPEFFAANIKFEKYEYLRVKTTL